MREATMQDAPKNQARDDFLAHAVADLLPPALVADPGRGAMRRQLDGFEAVFREAGVEPPAWLAMARRLHLGE